MKAAIFQPHNRHLWIQRPSVSEKAKEKETDLVFPESYKKKSEYEVVIVNAAASDSKFTNCVDKQVIVESNMIREVKIENDTFLVILENYVIGQYNPDLVN